MISQQHKKKPKNIAQPSGTICVYDDSPLSSVRARSPLKVKSDSPRSPLMTKDVNSPRAIVQRKQITKLGMLKGHNNKDKTTYRQGSKYQAVYDKENIDSN